METTKQKNSNYKKRLKYSIGEKLLKSNESDDLKVIHKLKDIPFNRDKLTVNNFISDAKVDIDKLVNSIKEKPLEATLLATYGLSVFYPRKIAKSIFAKFKGDDDK